MKTYRVEYQNVVIFNPKPLTKQHIDIEAESVESAAVKAVPKLTQTSDHMDVYNATVIGQDGEKYVILRRGSWLIDFETGERLSDLEEKVDKN